MEVRIEITPESRKHIEQFGVRVRRLRGTLNQAALRGGEYVASEIAAKDLTGAKLKVRTGMLRRSVSARQYREGEAICVAVGVVKGAATQYAAIHEHGGEIRPRKARALAVPVGEALTPSGRPRYPGGPADAAQKHDLFMVKRRGKPPLLAYTRGRGARARLIVLFVLLPKVRIKATHWLSEGVAGRVHMVRTEVDRAFTALLEGKLDGAE